jgi:hypothetical protein
VREVRRADVAALGARVNVEPRFIVSSVTGVTINPGSGSLASSHPLGTDYYVLDRAYCHREVARFASAKYRNQGAPARKRMAERRAAELNAWDATL